MVVVDAREKLGTGDTREGAFTARISRIACRRETGSPKVAGRALKHDGIRARVTGTEQCPGRQMASLHTREQLQVSVKVIK